MKKFGIIGLTSAMLISGCAVTPDPMTQVALTAYAEDQLAQVTADQEPVSGKVTLYEAMARALKYNLDHRVEMMARQLADRKLALASSKMLPDLVANTGYVDRNRTTGSFSRTLVSGVRSVEPSTSQEDNSLSGDLTFSWHLLDFGLSYVRAKQSADEALIAEERKRKVVNKIIEDVRTAYWRAVSADRLLAGFRRLEGRTQKALANSRKLYNRGLTSPISALTYQRELVDIKRKIQQVQRELTTSKMQLAALMNVRPNETFKLAIPKRRMKDLTLNISGEQMVGEALRNRAELREIAYRSRINRKEADAALLEILPGVSAYGGLNLDTNDYLVHNNWVSWGAKASWNLMRVFQYPARKKTVEAESELLDQRALAMTMAIMTQVHVARARYAFFKKSAATAAEYHAVQRKLLKQVKGSVAARTGSEQTLIREEMNTLLSNAKFDVAYADLQNAFAAIYASIGVDPHGKNISTDMSVSELSNVLKATWNSRGDNS